MAIYLLRIGVLCCFVICYALALTPTRDRTERRSFGNLKNSRQVRHDRSSRGNFILTSPRVIDVGSTVYFTLTVFNTPHGGDVTLRLTRERSNDLLAESHVSVHSNYSMWIEMNIPPLSSELEGKSYAELHVTGLFSNGYHIEAFKKVEIRHTTVLTFIQTDKPLYKPGQIIRFRVLPMDNRLIPLDNSTVGNVWIEDPTSIRVAQWKNVQFSEGIKEFELPLSEEPPLGTWNIETLINQVKTTQTFKVEKYVLPKFEVIIKPPKVVMVDDETIPIEICAKYIYGKIVEGNLKAKVTYNKANLVYVRKQSGIPSVEHQSQLSGCNLFNVNADDLLLHAVEYGGKELEVFAEVTENATGIVRNATAYFIPVRQKINLEFIKNNNYYKPKLQYVGHLKVTHPDESPAASERIEVCVTMRLLHSIQQHSHPCLAFTSDKSGMIQFTIMVPSTPLKEIKVEATAINYKDVSYTQPYYPLMLRQPKAWMTLYPWQSSSNEYLHIDPTLEEFECDKAQKVKVRYTASRGTTIKFYHQVLSKGRIVQQGSHQRTFYSTAEEQHSDFQHQESTKDDSTNNTTDIGDFILTFDTKASMSPISRLLVFYVREDGEVVADSRMFKIKRCLQNKVSLDFRHEQQYPNSEAAMLLSASPFSLCGIGMVDKSIRLLEDDTTFNSEKLFKILESYDVGPSYPDMPDMCGDDFIDENEHFLGYRPDGADAAVAFKEAGMIVLSDLMIENRRCRAAAFNLLSVSALYIRNGMPGNNFPSPKRAEPPMPPGSAKPSQPTPSEEIRSYFPETWLWELHSVGSNGETAIKRQLPHTITDWVGGAICVHPKTGLGISDSSSITTFQPFFIDFQLPYSVVRGESLTLTVTVFNYLSECLPIKLSIEPSDDYQLLSEIRYQKVCVCGGKSVGAHFPLRPTNLGMTNITAYGFSIEQDDEICGNEVTARLSARDAITKGLLVEAEGFPKEDVFNYFICPENTNGSVAIEVPLLLPDDVILDSARAYMSVTGDVMGPALKGVKKLVRLPVGCGEQNMVLFAPNMFVMDYLTSTNKISEEVSEECISNMKIGYQRELQYRHSDGSYSAFGSSDKEGSLWLTAFVLRSFGQARRFISIDENDLSLSKSWILKLQFENGCFKPSGRVFHKEMKGGLKSGDQTLAPLTAYVLISLLESEAEDHDATTVKIGLKCLEIESNLDDYVLSLFAYAFSLAKETAKAAEYIEELDKRAIHKGQMMYWETASQSKSVSIEIAGYYIMARLQVEDSAALPKVLPIVRWIAQQRNSQGGFYSTQDTVVALQALAKYAAYQSGKTLDIALGLETDDMSQGFKLDESNKLLTQQLKIPDVPTSVDIEAYGEGCAVVQFSLRYNVEKILNSGDLELDINSRRRGSHECNLPSLGICVRYAVHDEKTNMAVLSVKMPSGFVADEWSLLLLKNDKELQLMRHEIIENEVNLYFEEITNEIKCFEFHMKNEYEVNDVKPSIIRLYDYYQLERQVTKDYLIPSTCNATFLPDIAGLSPDYLPTSTDIQESSEILDLANADTDDMMLPLRSTAETLDEDKTVSKLDWDNEEVDELSYNDIGSIEILTTQGDTGQKLLENKSHLSTFTDIHQDLDFPDGLEGNMPDSILPPDSEDTNCPVCGHSFPENFTAIYCNSAFALKVIKRDINSRTVKILQDVSFYMDIPRGVKKFAELEYDEKCICPQITESISTCPPGKFQCDGSRCVDDRRRCDRRFDCSDRSDEVNCPEPATCQENEFRCGEGTCIKNELKCDRKYDCPDGSDELSCEPKVCQSEEFRCGDGAPSRCSPDQFRCSNGQWCIDNDLKCDRKYDCPDGSDETSCGAPEPTGDCSENQFKCGNGQCIDRNLRCDRRYDCQDGTDEFTCDGTILFIVGSPLNLWNSSGKKHRIHLARSVHVISVTQKQIHSFITEAKLSCADDP